MTGNGVSAVHGGSDPSLLAGTKNPASTSNTTAPAGFVCYNCHGNNTVGKNLSNKDIWTSTQATFFHPSNLDAKHNMATEATATWNNGAFSGTNRHANCQDCHAPHMAKKGLVSRTTTATSTRNALPPALTGATGVSFTSYPVLPTTACAASATLPNACFTQTSASNFGTSAVQATYEYQVCFKCHSSFAFGTTFPTATATSGGSAQTETDVAAEFSPTNRSGHPVVTGLNSYTGSTAPKSLVAAQLLAPWNVNVGTQTMLCTDCHNTDAASTAAQGPHGSAIPFMLTGTNRAWPYTTAGATSGTLRYVGNGETSLGTANGLFCRNCHPQQNSTASNAVHRLMGSSSQHSSSYFTCLGCHIRVPHGGKVSRLIVTSNAPARYKLGAPSNLSMQSFTKTAKDSYTWSNFSRSCARHGSGTGNEAW